MNQAALQAKKEAVAEISNGLKTSGSLTVVSYQGLTVAELSELRRILEKEESSLTVYKNTLVRRALADTNNPDLGEILNGPNAFVFSKELGKGPKALYKYARAHTKLVVKGGIAEGKVLDEAGVKTISKLPNKEGMLSMFLSCLKAPVTKFAATVKAIADKNEPADAPAAN